MDKQEMINDGFLNTAAQFLIDCERWCDQHYEYETSHKDAASNYACILSESGTGIDEYDVKEYVFSNVMDIPHSVFLGQNEMEIQLPGKLTVKEAEYFSHNTYYTVNGESDLAYCSYPSNLSVVAIPY